MFVRKKKAKKQQRALVHPQLGELRYGGGGWYSNSAIKMRLWNTVYDVKFTFIAEEEEEEINLKEEECFEKFDNIVIEQKDAIEQIILKYIDGDDGVDPSSRFIPRDVFWGRRGECVVFFEDTEEGVEYGFELDLGFALFISPKLMLGSSENYFDYLIGHGSFAAEELYGE